MFEFFVRLCFRKHFCFGGTYRSSTLDLRATPPVRIAFGLLTSRGALAILAVGTRGVVVCSVVVVVSLLFQ